MKRNTTWLSNILDWFRDSFEHASPSVLSALAVFLPYLTPLPIAFLTASSAEDFLDMTPLIAGIFVFVLEGIGLWSTTILVDSIVEYIRSKNAKSALMVFSLLIIVVAYVTILINLNVGLEEAVKDISPAYSRIITMICFLPLISGFMNGFWKLQLEHKTDMERVREIEEIRHQELRNDKKETEDKLLRDKKDRYMIKKGINPMKIYNLDDSSSPATEESEEENNKEIVNSQVEEISTDWRVIRKKLSIKQLKVIIESDDKTIQTLYGIKQQKTAWNWREGAKKELERRQES